jgi:uroporphyrinogen-III synthase
MYPQVSNDKPLSGYTVMVTRADHQAQGLADLLAPLGAEVVLQPAIQILETEGWGRFDAALKRFGGFSRVVLVSANAARFFFARISDPNSCKLTAADLARVEFAAIGSATAAVATAHGVHVALVPERSDSASLADLLLSKPAQGKTMVVRADRGSAVLADRLKHAGCSFEQFPIYRSQDVIEAAPEVLNQLQNDRIDWITVTSSAIGASLFNLFGEDLLQKTKLASISPTTTEALESLGLKVEAEAKEYNMVGLVAAIVASVES